MLTLLNVAPGPNPETTAVTTVPIGPDVGDSVTVAGLDVLGPKFTVATLPKLSVNVNAVLPAVVMPGRDTVPVYAPLVIALPLK